MLALRIRFLTGRYHATAWDHHVNEGTIEWPPSPWRILRALVAASYRLDPAPSDEALGSLLGPLAEALPQYRVPAYSEGHTRHYMPLDNKGLPGDKSAMIFNAFVAVGTSPDSDDGELEVQWPDVVLGEPTWTLLLQLCAQIGYLGRAESWAAITAVTGQREPANCFPATSVDTANSLRLMAPARSAEHVAWYQAYCAGNKKHPKGLPKTLLAVLRQDTGALRKSGWSDVPGARWVGYELKRRILRRRQTATNRVLPVYALVRLTGAVLPRVEKTLQLAERAHSGLVKRSAAVLGAPHPVFTGHGPTAGAHASVMPISLSGRPWNDHLLIAAPGGLDDGAVRSIQAVRAIYGVVAKPITARLVGLWTADEVGSVGAGLPATLACGKVWRSVTPFVLIRHPKIRGDGSPKRDANGDWIDGPEAQVRLELSRRGIAVPVEVMRLEAGEVGATIPWHRFQRKRRRNGGTRFGDAGYGFELRFATAVRGPISLGYGRFFGLGRFEPA